MGLPDDGAAIMDLMTRDARRECTAFYDGDGVGEPLQWYAIQTRHRHEKKVAEQLTGQAVESFLPLHYRKNKWRNGVTAEVSLPLFPGYLFARSGKDQRVRLLQIPGVIGMASSSSRPTAILDAEMSTLRAMVERYQAEPHPFLKVGDVVRIIAGPLAGMTGILLRR
jgi:transcription antitermination factor NusG